MVDVKVKILKNGAGALVPFYAHDGDAGCDVSAYTDTVVPAKGTAIVGTGLAIELPYGFEAQIRSRSGLAAKAGIFVLNSPGTIDCRYRGEVGVILHNTTNEDFIVRAGDRIAQMVIAPTYQAVFSVVPELDMSNDRKGGFGSTGV